MRKEDICGGIVTYNPEIEAFKDNVQNIAKQVNELVVIDNCSKNVGEIESLVNSLPNVILVKNDKNYGIARALNQILEYADEKKYLWYLTMDQDSICCEDLIGKYIVADMTNRDDVAVLCPYVLNNNKITLDDYKKLQIPNLEEVKQPIDCITSGSLNSVVAAKKIGGYNDALFIDCVDVEFNIRLLQAGYKILRINSAYMLQSMGVAKYVPMMGLLYKMTKKTAFKKLSYTPVYNNIRLYYIARNSKYVFQRYGEKAGKRMTPSWMRKQFIYYMITYPYNRNRIQMLKSINQGIKDASKMEER